MEFEARLESFREQLPEIGRQLIKEKLDLTEEANRRFFENPDDPAEHKPGYHEWGIITHSEMVREAYRNEVPRYLEAWGFGDLIDAKMAEAVDELRKSDLMEAVALLHDVGKFTARTVSAKADGSKKVNFIGHEDHSGDIIRSEEFSQKLRDALRLTDDQIEYVARCAELHFELGKVREELKKLPEGYTIRSIRSPEFRSLVRGIMDENKGYEVEIGLFFLIDSLGKVGIRLEAKTDEEREKKEPEIREMMEKAGTDPGLLKGIMQLPVNIAAVREYLKILVSP